jgi:uncharacterized protein YgbK (DUF1537 family)
MTLLRILADDLTGALDSAARFVPLSGPVPVVWSGVGLVGSAAIDAATRERTETEACAITADLASVFAASDIAFKKIDSLLRGHVAAELAVCMREFDHCVLAPAFPFQGRITRGGRQLTRGEAGWHDTGVDLRTALRARGLMAEPYDAESDADLTAIVESCRHWNGRILWCGTGGLAGALAGFQKPPVPDLAAPRLALIGSDHAVTRAQAAALGNRLHRIARTGDAAGLARRIFGQNAAVCVVVPEGSTREAARRHIAACFASLLSELERPGTLIVTGGETLRDLCHCLGVQRLLVDGEIAPGVPASLLQGGRWDGVRVISRSGAFGDAGLLRRLLGIGE